ncbi:MAG: MCP four helix bundle domain-containing protein [Aureliella sp.]
MVVAEEKDKSLTLLAIGGLAALFIFLVVYLLPKRSASEQLASKADRLETINRMRGALAAASEAQNSAVIAGSEKDAQVFVVQARRASAELDRQLTELKAALTAVGDQQELKLMSRVEQTLQDFQRLDQQLLDLAVQNTNRKAFQLAVGPAAKLVEEMDAALSRLVAAPPDSGSAKNLQLVQLASDTRISVLRIQLLLLPHIAEETDQKMDELEAQMDKQDQKIRENFKSLRRLLPTGQDADIAEAESRFDQFDKLRPEIIRLSRANTNVRSVAIAMSERRQAMLAVQDALVPLEHAIRAEEVVGR